MIFIVMLRQGLWRLLDAEKLRFMLGRTANPLFLSRRFPLVYRLSLGRLLFSRRYAEGVATWFRYRADLYEGRQG